MLEVEPMELRQTEQADLRAIEVGPKGASRVLLGPGR